jgi:DNA-binding transcriptional MerR regulator
LITPLRSAGGQRRYSRYQLRIAARARHLADQGPGIEAACRIVILEDQLEEALRLNTQPRAPGASTPRAAHSWPAPPRRGVVVYSSPVVATLTSVAVSCAVCSRWPNPGSGAAVTRIAPAEPNSRIVKPTNASATLSATFMVRFTSG